MKQRLRPLEPCKFTQGRKKTQEVQEEQRQPSDWPEEEIWTVEEFTSRRSSVRSQKGETDSRRIPYRNPVSHWICEGHAEVKPWCAEEKS
jgi:hypothetical protein